VTASTLVASSPAQTAPAAEGLNLIAVKESLLATHYWYEQTANGYPVLGSFYVKHVDRATGAVTVEDGRISVMNLPQGKSAVSVQAKHADEFAAKQTGAPAYRSRIVVVPGETARLAWQVHTEPAGGSVSTLVDAGSGDVISSTKLVKEATGTGKVFDPNPVVAQQDSTLKDDSPASAFKYKLVHLTHLYKQNRLIGDYAKNMSDKAVVQTSGTFAFERSHPGFAQVMAYYHITSAQEYLQSLGFTGTRGANAEPQKYKTTGLTADNSFYDPATDQITFGTGGVDDAEDAEVIWHEYGHAIQDAQVPGFGASEEAGSIGEGFGDYMAYTMSQPVSPNTSTTPWACIADWDATSYTPSDPHCLRRTDGNKMYPADMTREVHADGEIWSRALTDINTALGRTTADKIIVEAQFGFTPDTSFTAAAQKTVAAANTLYGVSAADAVTAAFHARGIL
jgi:Zn-dependent metalloprotease